MKAVTLKAHFDGEKICLDEPFRLDPGAKVFVTVVSGTSEGESEEWYELGRRSLARAYGQDEPDYSDLLQREQ